VFCAELSHYNVYLRQQLSVMQQFGASINLEHLLQGSALTEIKRGEKQVHLT